MSPKVKQIFIPTVTLTLICLIITCLLAVTNDITADKISQQNAEAAAASRLEVLPGAADFEEKQEGDVTYYIGKDQSGQDVGYVFTTAAAGYGGDVEVMTGIGTDGVVTGVTILSHSETPGLGAKADDPSFTDRYKKAVPDGGFVVKKGSASADNEVAAITGATITSTAVTNAVNEAVELYSQVKGGQ